MSKNKDKKRPVPSVLDSSSKIKATSVDDQTIMFSFKHFDNTNEKFSISNSRQPYFDKLLTRLQDVSRLKESELRFNNAHGLRSHSIKWNDTTEPLGFKHLKGQLRDIEGWQFEISSNKYGRVHGLLLNGVFYVIWFDPEHLLYSR